MRVLLIEDEAAIASAVRRGLEIEGFAIDIATDGEEGLELARTGAFDAIILDIMLPKMNGFLVCRALRAAEDWTPILMLTAKDGEYDQAEALDTGADDYLSKPFSFVVLLARLRALIRRSGPARARPTMMYSAGDLCLDPVAHRCVRGDVEIALTAREFAVLEFFMRNIGATLSKSEIIANVWDFAFEGDVNIVEVYVRHLRMKIDEPFGRKAIETVRGVGYRLHKNGG